MMSSIIALANSLISFIPAAPPDRDPALKETPPASPTPPVTAPEVRTDTSAVIAVVELENGEVIRITDAAILQKLSESNTDLESAPRLVQLQLKYKALTELMSAARDRGTLKNFTLLDPSMKAMYQITLALMNDLSQEALGEIEKQLFSLDPKNPDKPYLLQFFTVRMLEEKKISPEKAEALLLRAIEKNPAVPELYYEAYKLAVLTNRLDEAYRFLTGFIQAKTGITDLDALPPDNLELLAELSQFYLLKSEAEKNKKKYSAALQWLNKAEKAIKRAEAAPALSLFLADLYQKKAEVYLLQEENFDAYKALEFSVDTYRKALEKDPENPALYFRLVNIYAALIKVVRLIPALAVTQPGLIKYNPGRCRYQVDHLFEKIETLSRDDPKLLPDLFNAYLSFGKVDEALATAEKSLQQNPLDAALLLQMGDLYLSKGEIARAFEYYTKALELAQEAEKETKLELLSQLHVRYSLLRMQSELGQTQHKAGQLNFAQAGLNMLIIGLIASVNPYFAMANIVELGAKSAANRNFSEDEWKEIIQKAGELEKTSFDALYSAAQEENNPAVFFFIANSILEKTNSVLLQVKEMEKQVGVTEEEIKAYREISAKTRRHALRAFNLTLSRGFTERLEAELIRAQTDRNPSKMLEIADTYFGLYFFLLQKEKDKNLDSELKKALAEKKEAAFEKGLEVLEEIADFGEESSNLQFTFGVFQLGGKVEENLRQASAFAGKKELKDKIKKINEMSSEALAATIEIAADNQDLDSLLELGKNIYALGPFSQKAFEEAIDLAGEDEEKLFKIGTEIYLLYRKEVEGADPIRTIDTRATLRRLAVSVYEQILETARGENKISAYRQLWIFGEYETAYLGYVSLVNEYKDDKKMLGNLFYELGLMAAARGKKDKAIEWFKRAPQETELPVEQKDTINFELRCLETGAVPAWFKIKGATSLLPEQLRANMILYTVWTRDYSPSLLETAVADLYAAQQRSAAARVTPTQEGLELEITEEQCIDSIEVLGNKYTDTEVILREFKYAGLNRCAPRSTDPEEIHAPLNEAANRLKTFLIRDTRIIEKEGKKVLVVRVEEPLGQIYDFTVGGGVGNAQSFFLIRTGYNSLFGGGEKGGVEFSHHWFYADGYKNYSTWNGRLYYLDPHLFVLGEETPVSGGFNLERQARMNYASGGLERLTGGSVTLGVKIARGTTLSVSPTYYYVESTENYSQASLRIALEKDGRDNWLFPNSGYYLSTAVEPGMRMNGASQFFVNNINEGRVYVPLPLGMVLAVRGVAGAGYNLTGGGQYWLGANMLNPYVRAADGSPAIGFGLLSGSLEVRAPLIDGGENFKAQFYAFGDTGIVLGSRGLPLFSGAGGGVRMGIPVLKLINFGYGFPGGFFIWFGDLGWN